MLGFQIKTDCRLKEQSKNKKKQKEKEEWKK